MERAEVSAWCWCSAISKIRFQFSTFRRRFLFLRENILFFRALDVNVLGRWSWLYVDWKLYDNPSTNFGSFSLNFLIFNFTDLSFWKHLVHYFLLTASTYLWVACCPSFVIQHQAHQTIIQTILVLWRRNEMRILLTCMA